MDFHGKTVIVTGGAQGIGLATSLSFARAGASVIIADIDEEAGCEVMDKYRDSLKIDFKKTDVSSEDDVRNLVNHAISDRQHINILINNAAIGWEGDLLSRSTESWNRLISINLTGTYLMVKHCYPNMRTAAQVHSDHVNNQGNIVNISSTRAIMSERDSEPYSASKGGVLALTHSLAISLGPEIRVNCVSPGWIDVSSWKKRSTAQRSELSVGDHRQHPVGRVGKPEDIANACLFLCSDMAGFITGANLVVDGGMTRKMIYTE